LVATRRPHSRDHLCELFWEGPDDPRGALRWSLAKIRSLLGDAESEHLIADRERIVFDPAGAVVDLISVDQDVRLDLEAGSTEALTRAAGCFRGEFLDGADLPACYRYHEWWVAERESLRGLRMRILSVLVERLRGQPESALAYARVRVQIDPFSEAA